MRVKYSAFCMTQTNKPTDTCCTQIEPHCIPIRPSHHCVGLPLGLVLLKSTPVFTSSCQDARRCMGCHRVRRHVGGPHEFSLLAQQPLGSHALRGPVWCIVHAPQASQPRLRPPYGTPVRSCPLHQLPSRPEPLLSSGPAIQFVGVSILFDPQSLSAPLCRKHERNEPSRGAHSTVCHL